MIEMGLDTFGDVVVDSPHAAMMKSIELYGTEVIPRVRLATVPADPVRR